MAFAWVHDRAADAAAARAAGPRPARAAPISPPASLMGRVARAVGARPGVFAAVAGVLTLLSLWEVRHFGRDQLEYDFSRLRRRDTWVAGEGYWGKRMDTLLGRYLTPTVILTDNEAEARAVTAKLREQASHPPLASMVASIRHLGRRGAARRSRQAGRGGGHPAQDDAEHPRQHRARRSAEAGSPDRPCGGGAGRAVVSPIQADEIPDVLTRGLRERDGSVGRAVLVYPEPGRELVARRDHRDVRAPAARRRPRPRPRRAAAPGAWPAARRCRTTSSRRWSATDRWRRVPGLRGRGGDGAAHLPARHRHAVRDRLAGGRRALAAGASR